MVFALCRGIMTIRRRLRCPMLTAKRPKPLVSLGLYSHENSLGDVRVTSLSETYDERLEVIVAGGGCERVFVIVSRPSSAGEVLAKAWTLGGSAKEQWINFVQDLNRQILETDRKRLFK